MTEKPCTRCHGSGTEPDRARQEWDRIRTHIAAANLPDELDKQLHYDAFNMRSAHLAVEEEQQARITFLEAALRDILSRFREPYQGSVQLLQVPNEDLRGWRVVLDGRPGDDDRR